MRVLLDTNILLDVLLDRQPWVVDSSAVWRAHDEGRITGYVTACAINDVFYIARRLVDQKTAHLAVDICLDAFQICVVDRHVLEQAQVLPGSDFEDSVQIACAASLDLDAIVTRNTRDFAAAGMPVLVPAELLAQLEQR